MRICVVGAGVLGLSEAYEMAKRGHEVTLVDREGPFAGASRRSFAWINANNKFPSSYHRLNELGVEEHQRMQESLSAEKTWLHLSGNILVDFSAAREDTYFTRMSDAQAEDYPVDRLDRSELESLEPGIVWPKGLDSGLFYPKEGYLDNDILGQVLIEALNTEGVSAVQREVERIDSDGEGAAVVFADGGSELFDRAVIAAGAWSRQLGESSGFRIPAADLSVPSNRTHSLLGLTAPADVELKHVLISDRINVRPRHDGRMWVQIPSVEQRVEEGESPQLLAEVGAAMESELERLFGKKIPVGEVIFSGRSFPEDGLSIVGFVDASQKVYCTVTHSGMTLAALFARLAADELEGHESELLADFRPARFKDGVAQYADYYFIGKQ